MSDIRHALGAVRERIDRACAIAGRDPGEVTLVAVTKTVDVSRVVEAIEAGVGDIGENYVQEAKGKIEAIGPGRARWHMIGHIQSNKVKHIPALFDCVHTVDSIAILEGLEKRGKEMNVLFEVNLAGEATKSGTDVEGLRRILERASSLVYLKPVGLMTMPPYVEDPEEVRGVFGRLRMTLEMMNAEFGLAMRELSMGMSSDFEVAVEEGATMVRVGTALFGERR